MLRLIIKLIALLIAVRDFCVFQVDEDQSREAIMVTGNVTLFSFLTFSFSSCWLTYSGNLQRSHLQYIDVSFWHPWMNGIKSLVSWQRELAPLTGQVQLMDEGEMYFEDWAKLQ